MDAVEIVENFPARTTRGVVCGFYVYRVNERLSGPHATPADAHAARDGFLAGTSVICGPVFTDSGTVVIADHRGEQ